MTDQKNSNVLRFKRKRRRGSKNDAPARVLAFPPGRHRRIVAFIARDMRKQPSPEATEKYLVDHLEIEWRRLADLGIADDVIEGHCREFALATWAIVLRGSETEGVA
jgi:hypothetical protein